MQKNPHILDIDGEPTVEAVINLFGGPLHAYDNVTDEYHKIIVHTAYRLRQTGMTDWIYVTGFRSSALWKSPTGNGYLTVYVDGDMS